jgi:hypothetical protein
VATAQRDQCARGEHEHGAAEERQPQEQLVEEARAVGLDAPLDGLVPHEEQLAAGHRGGEGQEGEGNSQADQQRSSLPEEGCGAERRVEVDVHLVVHAKRRRVQCHRALITVR